MSKRSAQHIDALVGNNIKIARLQRGISQSELGRLVDVSFQQIQKYETGANRVGASRVMKIAESLNVPIHALFGSAKDVMSRTPNYVPVNTLVARPEAMRLLQAFDRIDRGGVKVAALHLIEAVGEMRIRSAAGRGRRQ